MKKKITLLLLSALLAVSAAACTKNEESDVQSAVERSAEETAVQVDTREIIGKLTGTWVKYDEVPKEEISDLLVYFNFTEEERALSELSGMGIACTVRFTEDGRYAYAYDYAATVNSVKGYYDRFITTLFENRENLTATYGSDILERCPSLEDFHSFYAYMFNRDDYEAMLDAMLAESLDLDALNGTLEEGRYTISLDGTLNATAEGSSTAYTIGYEFTDGNALKLIYSDGEENYTRLE